MYCNCNKGTLGQMLGRMFLQQDNTISKRKSIFLCERTSENVIARKSTKSRIFLFAVSGRTYWEAEGQSECRQERNVTWLPLSGWSHSLNQVTTEFMQDPAAGSSLRAICPCSQGAVSLQRGSMPFSTCTASLGSLFLSLNSKYMLKHVFCIKIFPACLKQYLLLV